MRCFSIFCVSVGFIFLVACSSPINESNTDSQNLSSSDSGKQDTVCNVIFYANGGKIGDTYSKTFSYEKNQKISLPTTEDMSLERYGYKFLGWSQNAYTQEAEYSGGADYTVLVSTMFYAIWKAYSEFTFSVSVNEQSDIKVDVAEDETLIIFSPQSDFDSYVWKIDGEEVYQTSCNKEYQCKRDNLSKGVHSLSLEAKKADFWYSFSAQITVE